MQYQACLIKLPKIHQSVKNILEFIKCIFNKSPRVKKMNYVHYQVCSSRGTAEVTLPF